MGSRWNRGFRQAGTTRLGRALPARNARQLRLSHAFSRVAGEAIVRRVESVVVRRGILEVEVAVSDPLWAETVAELLPALAGRLEAAYPDLGIKKCRLVVPGAELKRPARPLAAPAESPDDTTPAVPTRSVPPTRGDAEIDGTGRAVSRERLEAAMERYLSRRDPGQKP